MLESAAHLYCKPEVQFKSKTYSIEGKTVLEIYIPQVDKKPVYARDETNKWMAYIRVGDQNALAGIIQLQVWKDETKTWGRLLEYTRREEILLEYLGKEPGVSLSKIQRDTGYRRKELIELMTKLVRFDVVEMTFKDGTNRFSLREDPGEGN